MSTRPARITSRLIILAASAMSVSRVVNSPVASGWSRPCWSRNWERVRARSGAGRSVREATHVLVAPGGGHSRPDGRERSRNERGMALGQRARSGDGQLVEQEAELIFERESDRGAHVGREPPQLA